MNKRHIRQEDALRIEKSEGKYIAYWNGTENDFTIFSRNKTLQCISMNTIDV